MSRAFRASLMCLMAVLWLMPQAPPQQMFAQEGGQAEGKKEGKQQDQTRSRQGKQRNRRRGRRSRPDDAPKVGDMAPTFTLKSLDGDSSTNLADYRGKKPVVLLFGSYT